MNTRVFSVVCCVVLTASIILPAPLWGQSVNIERLELAKYGRESSSVHLQPARLAGKPGIAVVFEGTSDLHYYAKSDTAPSPGLELRVRPTSQDFTFGEPVFPTYSTFTDPLGRKVHVYAGNFTVFIPITAAPQAATAKGRVEVTISGIACTSQVCIPPFENVLQTQADYAAADSWPNLNLETHPDNRSAPIVPAYSVAVALVLALLAGMSLNIMPCVWPVLPLIVMRIVDQAGRHRTRASAMGLAFCTGILLFFAALAGLNLVLQAFYGTVLQWGDQFRSPGFVTAMSLLLVVLALSMFGLFSITLPGSIAGKSGSGKGFLGSVATGFLAAILSTPCSFAVLAAAFAWAQAQPPGLATLAIMTIGFGMALPYAVLTSIPGLLNRIPKPGRWMELFKQFVGFLLLVIAVKLVTAVPAAGRTSVLYYSIILAFCVWMWAGWVGYGTRPSHKYTVRIAAVLLAVGMGWMFLKPKIEIIHWQSYDAPLIQKYLDENRPVLIKFTADWCFNCEFVEKLVYGRRDVAGLIRQKAVLAVKADTTAADYPAAIDLKAKYSEPAVPVSILFLPGRGEPVRFRGIAFANQLKEYLDKL